MTLFPDLPRRPTTAHRFALCLALACTFGLRPAAAEDAATNTNTNIFNAPGYAPAIAPKAGVQAGQGGAAQGQGGTPIDAASQRLLQNQAQNRAGTAAHPTAGTDAAQRRADLPPPKASEFQKFVEGATGRLLPLFGSSFFSEAAASFEPLDNVPVSADYTVGPGDELVLRAWGSIDVDYRATVDRNGLLNLPKVGSFNVAGVKSVDLEKNLRAQIGRLFTNFELSVSLGQLRGLKLFVVGPAQRPGVYTLASQSTLLSAVVTVGGPASNGSMRKVLLRRDGRVISELDIYEFLVQGDKSKDVQLAAGDVVVFQPAGARVALNGALDTPAIYELKSPQEPLREVLLYAGGTPSLANPNRAQLERIDVAQPKAARFVEELRLDGNGLQKPLRDGDVLTLLAISPQFANAVTLKGHVAGPLRYAFKPGMRIRDLIPNPDALISGDFYRRKNLLVQMIDGPVDEPRKAPTALFDDLNWDYAVVERLNHVDLSTQVISFNLGKAVMQGDAAQNIELVAGDVVTIYGQKDVRVPVARQTRLVLIEGEVASPGVYQLLPGETLTGLIERSGGFTPQAYPYGVELSREDTRRRQSENLSAAVARLEALLAVQAARDSANRRDDVTGAATSTPVSNTAAQAQLARLRVAQPNGRIALELDPDARLVSDLPALPLDGGDRIVVPPRPGFVTVAGAVVNSNAFVWKPGRTAGEYLRLAGADEAAEPSNMFVLRADGTVSHSGDKRGLFGRSNLESQVMHPGDALIVPNQIDFETWGRAFVRNLKDFAQIFTGFGIGVAAIHAL